MCAIYAINFAIINSCSYYYLTVSFVLVFPNFPAPIIAIHEFIIISQYLMLYCYRSVDIQFKNLINKIPLQFINIITMLYTNTQQFCSISPLYEVLTRLHTTYVYYHNVLRLLLEVLFSDE